MAFTDRRNPLRSVVSILTVASASPTGMRSTSPTWSTKALLLSLKAMAVIKRGRHKPDDERCNRDKDSSLSAHNIGVPNVPTTPVLLARTSNNCCRGGLRDRPYRQHDIVQQSVSKCSRDSRGVRARFGSLVYFGYGNITMSVSSTPSASAPAKPDR